MSAPKGPMATPAPWDEVAEAYEDELVPQFAVYAEEALRLAAPAADARVVDVACGPGTLALRAADRVAHVAAVDFAPAMIARLRARAAREGRTNVEAQVADGEALPFDAASFDAAFSLFGLMFFPDRARGFAELHRVLRPGAPAVVSSWLPPTENVVFSTFFGEVARRLPPGPPPPLPALADAASIVSEMQAAGFRDVKVERFDHAPRFASTDAMWASFTRSSAPAAAVRALLGEATWREIDAAIASSLRARLGAGPQTPPMPAWIALARR